MIFLIEIDVIQSIIDEIRNMHDRADLAKGSCGFGKTMGSCGFGRTMGFIPPCIRLHHLPPIEHYRADLVGQTVVQVRPRVEITWNSAFSGRYSAGAHQPCVTKNAA